MEMQRCEELIALMDATGKTLDEFAVFSGVSKSTLLRYRGGKSPDPGAREVLWLANALEVDRGWLRSIIVETAEANARIAQEEDVKRREFLKAAAVGVGVIAGGKIVAPRLVGEDEVAGLTALRKTLVGSDAVLGAGPVMQSAIEQVDRIDALVRQTRGSIRSQLFEVGSMFCEFAGWLADDLGDAKAGAFWTGRALDWGHASGNPAIVAYVLQRKAQQAVLHGNGALAIALVDAISTKGVQVRVLAAAAQQQAHGFALEGNEKGALGALDRATQMLMLLDDEEATPFKLASWCTPAYLEAQRGACLTRVGRPAEAVAAFDAALGVWPETYRRERGLHLARKSVAVLAAGDPIGAAVVGRESTAILAQVRSARALDELRMVGSALAEFDTTDAEVSGFRNELRQLTA